MRVVIVPYMTEEKIKELKHWDLWGPFLLCSFLCIILTLSSHKKNSVTFVSVFFIIWVGSILISLNTKLIGGKL
jgi:hypothetical protein